MPARLARAQASVMLALMQTVIISGLSGSGKSIALNMLEDTAYYCVDNLPSQLLQQLVDHLITRLYQGSGGYDIRGGESIAMLPQQLAELRANELELQFFFDAKTETLSLFKRR